MGAPCFGGLIRFPVFIYYYYDMRGLIFGFRSSRDV